MRQAGMAAQVSGWRGVVILLAVAGLAISVATRYSALSTPGSHAGTHAASNAKAAKRDHLVNDGLHWTAPAANFLLFKPWQACAMSLCLANLVKTLCTDNSLHNRPPPRH